MPDELQISSRPELERPVLIAAFRGWNDGGQGASLATGYLAKLWEAKRFAEIDPENFFDFQATRPHVSLEEGLTRKIDWPATVFYHARPPGFERDVVLLLGMEPNLRWRTFTDMIVDVPGRAAASTSSSRSARCWPTFRTRGRAPSRAARPTGARATSRPLGIPLRGPDRDRRRPPRCVPPGRDLLGKPLGGGSALRLADAEPEGGARPQRPARRPPRAPTSTRASWPRPPRTTRSRSRKRSPPTRTPRRTSRSWSSGRTRSPRRPNSRPETRSPRSSRASCASETRARRRRSAVRQRAVA